MTINGLPQNDVSMDSDLFGDRYQFLGVLGKGGMGTVYKAQHTRLAKLVAIKVLNASLAIDADSRARFTLEAQAGGRLAHPNLVAVFDSGFTSKGEPYIVMEYVEGESLDRFLKSHALPTAELLHILIEVCKALRYLHQNNVVHRDLKTSNIMVHHIGDERFAKLLDLGIAKVFATDGQQSQHLTSTGAVFGSPLYMSPEQCWGTAVDARSDIYSFGCVLYECLSGVTPFVGDNPMQTMYKHLHEEAAPLQCQNESEYALEQVVSKCIRKLPEQRYPDVASLLADLTAITSSMPGARTGAQAVRGRVPYPTADNIASPQIAESAGGNDRSRTGNWWDTQHQAADNARFGSPEQPTTSRAQPDFSQSQRAPEPSLSSQRSGGRTAPGPSNTVVTVLVVVGLGAYMLFWLVQQLPFILQAQERVPQLKQDVDRTYDVIQEKLRRANMSRSELSRYNDALEAQGKAPAK
jgi:serine/threonine protein kinase